MNPSTFRALKNRPFRLYFLGQALSLLGTWMQKTAVSWVVYSLTHSKLMLGVSVFATLFPAAVFSLVGGGVADRYNRYRVLLTTQVLAMLQAALLTLTVYLRPEGVWGIIGLSVVLGIINGFDVPARQSLVHQLVEDKQDLPNALALNSSMVNLSKLLGPAIAGLAIERLGATVCFGLNALSFVAVIGSLLALRLPVHPAAPRQQNLLGELREGLHYLQATPNIRFVVLMLALVSLLALPFTTLLPVYAKDVFHGTASTFGLLDSAIGAGAFGGALYLASRPPGTDLNRVLMRNTLVFGAGLLLFSHAPTYGLALLCLAVSAFGMMSQVTLSNTLLQTTARPDMRGRVISFYVLAYTAMVPLGSLLVSWVSQRIGVQNAVLGQGLAALGLGGLHWRALRNQVLVPTELPPQATTMQGVASSSQKCQYDRFSLSYFSLFMNSSLATALLVMDVQPALLPLQDPFLATVARAIAHARQQGIPVLYVVLSFRPGAPEMVPPLQARLGRLDPAEFSQIAPAVAPQPGELTIVKRRISAFAGSDLEVVLRTAGIRHLLLTGMATSGVVLSTLCEAHDKDYQVTVLADACLDRDPEAHRVLMEKVFPRRAQVLTVAEWVSQPA